MILNIDGDENVQVDETSVSTHHIVWYMLGFAVDREGGILM